MMIDTEDIMIALAPNPRGYKGGATALLIVNGVEDLLRLPPGNRPNLKTSEPIPAKYEPPGSENPT